MHHRPTVVGLLASMALCLCPGCQGLSSVRCGTDSEGWYCPGHMVCNDTHRCVTPIQIQQCADKNELAPCELPGVPPGTICRHKACVVPFCGDKVLDSATEECDADLHGETCQTQGFEGGTLACTGGCAFDKTDCYKCGDQQRHEAEECDGADLAGESCQTQGFEGGTLACENCRFSFAGCSTAGFVQIKAGTFTMSVDDACSDEDETQHPVELTRDYELYAHEVTQADYLKRIKTNPSVFPKCGPDCPVDSVSWHEAAAYCNALSDEKKLARCYDCNVDGQTTTCSEAAAYSGAKVYDCPGYRLPTEAEWERAYRAGSDTPFYPSPGNNGAITACDGSDPNADAIAWYIGNATVTYQGCHDLTATGGPKCAGPFPKATKAPNAWGLYDMAGNVWEWCHDRYQKDLGSSKVTDPWGSASAAYRVIRGGPYSGVARFLRAATRTNYPEDYQLGALGFRPCRTRQ